VHIAHSLARGVAKIFVLDFIGRRPHMDFMTFADWLEKQGLDDAAAGKLLARDRSHISKLRRGKHRPSYELMLLIAKVSKGAVGLETWR
jgi:hypothetical protein